MASQKMTAGSSLFDGPLLRAACADALRKLSPRTQWANPVMFVVYLGAILTSLLWLQSLAAAEPGNTGFTLAIALWLWFTVLFANFAEALAEGRSRAQAASLHGMKRDTVAKVLQQPQHGSAWIPMRASELRKGVVLLVEAGDVIALDGTVIDGVASVDESAITGESAPVIREAGGDFSSVTGGTRVLSDWLVVEVTVNPGESFLDRMISMVESAKRQKTPNELALTILLVGLTLVFLLVIVPLWPFSAFAVAQAGSGTVVGIAVLVALLVCLIPTTSGGLLSAIGVAGMSRMMPANVIATSAALWRLRAMWTCCCSTRPAPSPWATARRASFCPRPASAPSNWPRPHSCPRWPTKRQRAAAWSPWRKSATACPNARPMRCQQSLCLSPRRRA